MKIYIYFTLFFLFNNCIINAQTRYDVIARAYTMEQYPWSTREEDLPVWNSNYMEYACIDNCCFWNDCSYDEKMCCDNIFHYYCDYDPNSNYFGLPYAYGHKDSPEAIIANLSWPYGLTPGNHICHYKNYNCCNGYAPPPWSTGMDCSAFVCYALDINQAGSSELATMGEQVDFESAQKGDILVYPGVHVMLIDVNFPDEFWVYEASGSENRVRQCTYTKKDLRDKYTARDIFYLSSVEPPKPKEWGTNGIKKVYLIFEKRSWDKWHLHIKHQNLDGREEWRILAFDQNTTGIQPTLSAGPPWWGIGKDFRKFWINFLDNYENPHNSAERIIELRFPPWWGPSSEFKFQMKGLRYVSPHLGKSSNELNFITDTTIVESEWSEEFSVPDVLNGPPEIISLNGDEFVPFGSSAEIYWAPGAMGYNAKIEFSKDAGATWTTLAPSISNIDPYYFWDFDTSIPPSNICLIRVSDITNSLISDMSDKYFKIFHPSQNITLNAPNGGTSYIAGDPLNITWNTQFFGGNVELQYSNDDGYSWQTISHEVPHDQAYFAWTLPEEATHKCRVMVKDAYHKIPRDSSDACFEIINPIATMRLDYPNGTQLFQGGSEVSIVWENIKFAGNVKLEYSTNNGISWITIVDNESNIGTYNWTLPDIESHQYLVRVSDSFNTALNDVSDSPFSVTNTEPVTLILQPNSENGMDNSLEFLSNWAGTSEINNGNIFQMGCGFQNEDSNYKIYRALLKFDLSSINFSYIQSAQLHLYCYNNESADGTEVFILYQVLQNWEEMQSCWKRPKTGGINWNGCEPVSPHAKTDPFTSLNGITMPGWMTCNMRDQVHLWVSNPTQNHGFLIKLNNDSPPSSNHSVKFYSSDYEDLLKHPKLEIVYFPSDVMPNQPPSVYAGEDITINENDILDISGDVCDDGLPIPPATTTVQWSSVSGSGLITFGNVTSISTTVSFSETGDYVIRLTSSDGQLTGSDDMTVHVLCTSQILSPVADNFLEIHDDNIYSGDVNNGGTIQIGVGTRYKADKNQKKRSRAVMQFDLSPIPENAIIDTAKLKLYCYSYNNELGVQTLNVHKILIPWDEYESCWKRPMDGGVNWDGCKPDNNYATSTVLASTIIYKTIGWYEWNFLSLVQEWVAVPESNHGFLMKLSEDEYNIKTKTFYFFSREYTANPDLCPKLKIRYHKSQAKGLNNQDDEIVELEIPIDYGLFQNYPNPFNPSTTFSFMVPEEIHVKIAVYDIMGHEVIRLIDERKKAGFYKTVWNGCDNNIVRVSTGIYFIHMEAGDRLFTKKMLLLK